MEKRALIVTALAGFVTSFLMNDISILQEMGFEVHCAANANHPGAEGVVDKLQSNNIVFHQVNFSSSEPLSPQTILAYEELRRLRDSVKFDFVHCHTPIAGAITRICFKRKRRLSNVKVAYTTHGFYFHKGSSWKGWLIYRTIEDLMSRYTDLIITINQEDKANAEKMHCQKVEYIPGVGVDIDRFKNAEVDKISYRSSLGIKPSDFVIVTAGEVSYRKNQRVIIEALAKLDIPNAVFLVCGNSIANPELLEKLKFEAKELHVDARFLGRRKDIAQIYKCADIGVLPSAREGLGLAGIEMIASGLPIVASNVQGIPDYVEEGVNGLLCNPANSSEFASAILRLTKAGERARLSDDTGKTVKKFDILISTNEMRRIYRNLLSDGSDEN